MADTKEELHKTVAEQEQQIRTLKQALMRLEQKLSQVSAVAHRAQELSRINKEQWQIVQRRLERVERLRRKD